MDHTLLAPCPVIHNSSHPWELRVLQVVATGITLRNLDLAWALKDTVRCQATGGVFQAVLVDTAAGTRCKVAMVALQALVDILPMVNPAITVATRVDTATSSNTTKSKPVAICILLLFSDVSSTTLYTTTSLHTTAGLLESTLPGLEYIRLALMACMHVPPWPYLIVHSDLNQLI